MLIGTDKKLVQNPTLVSYSRCRCAGEKFNFRTFELQLAKHFRVFFLCKTRDRDAILKCEQEIKSVMKPVGCRLKPS